MARNVAVIGAGPSGLCCVRHLSERPNDFNVVCFEKSSNIGGMWVYSNNTGLDDEGQPVHSSLYRNLKTNLPKEIMAFKDFPFSEDLPSFMNHEDVLKYIRDYAERFRLLDYIKLETCVDRVHPVKTGARLQWEVTTRGRYNTDEVTVQLFDAVLVCNGHLSVPNVPKLPGLESYQGIVAHSHNYRHPENYQDKRVLVLGAAASGQDIAVELSGYCKQIYVCSRKVMPNIVYPACVVLKPGIREVLPNGAILENGEELQDIDVILLCTGYLYRFPFMTPECGVVVEEKRVSPMYKHMLHMTYPTLQFIGLCRLMVTFRHMDAQVLFGLAALDGSMVLPSRAEMETDTEKDHKIRMGKGMTHAHNMGPLQEKYHAELARLAKFEPIPNVIHKLFNHTIGLARTQTIVYKKRNFRLVDTESFIEVLIN